MGQKDTRQLFFMNSEQRINGSLLGGAYGDSLGAAVEFKSSDQIKQEYGSRGISQHEPVFGRAGNVTDDTQMTMATAEGLADVPPGMIDNRQLVRDCLWRAYRRWYKSQAFIDNRRAPGNTCMASLKQDVAGSRQQPLNWSAGCGGIMRVHPVGLALADRDLAWQTGVDSAALTHGHENAQIPAGFLSVLVSDLAFGLDFDQAFASAYRYLDKQPQADETIAALDRAASADTQADSFELIDGLGGGGWLGHDALAIATYAIRRAGADPLESVRLAVNHGGDSDSTGAIAGAIVGTIHGPKPFETDLEKQGVEIEHRRALGRLALDLVKIRD